MIFSLYAPILFILQNLNSSIDIIQHDRFERERRRAQQNRYVLSNFSKYEVDLVTSPGNQSEKSTACASFKDHSSWFLEYNQVGLIHLFISLIHIPILIFAISKSILYSSLSNERESFKGEYKDPILKFMESIYLFNWLSCFKRTRQYNRLYAFMLTQILINKLRSIYMSFKNAKINRYQYKKVNTVQMNIAYIIQKKVSFRKWVELMFKWANHKCLIGTNSTSNQYDKMNSEFIRKIKSMDKIDRVYYYNLIDFNECHDSIEAREKVGKEDDERQYDDCIKLDIRKNSIYQESLNSYEKLKSWSKFVFLFEQPNRRHFLAHPFHRLDPKHMLHLSLYYLVNMSILIGFFVMSIGSLLSIELRTLGLKLPNWQQTLPLALKALFHSQRYILSSVEGLFMIIIICLNVSDNALLVMSSNFCKSRAFKVRKLINKEVTFYQVHLNRYKLRAANRGVSLQDLIRIEGGEYTEANRGLNFRNIRSGAGMVPISDKDDATIEHRKWRQSQVDLDFNDNISHLIDLIGILIIELNDHKDYFTFSIDLRILFGTVGSAIAFRLLNEGDSTCEEIVLLVAALAANITPSIISLVLGATAEYDLRQICRSLMPLMINESHLLELSVVEKLHKIHDHLLMIENRAFVLFENFPLTSGSLASILGWTATANLVFQRFCI